VLARVRPVAVERPVYPAVDVTVIACGDVEGSCAVGRPVAAEGGHDSILVRLVVQIVGGGVCVLQIAGIRVRQRTEQQRRVQAVPRCVAVQAGRIARTICRIYVDGITVVERNIPLVIRGLVHDGGRGKPHLHGGQSDA